MKQYLSLLLFIFLVAGTGTAHAMGVVPSFTDVSTDKSQIIKRTIKITNDEQQDIRFMFEPTPIKFDATGRAEFLTDPSKTSRSMIGWITIDKGPYVVPPGQSQEVPFTITVPLDVSPGGYYGSLLVSRLNESVPDKDVSIALTAKVASLLFVNIGGDTTEKAITLETFRVPQKLYLAPPVKFLVKLKNTTDTHLQPHGTIDLTNTFTGKNYARLLINEDSLYLFPNTEKSFQLIWQPSKFSSFWPLDWGRYVAHMKVSAADSSERTATITFWILPHYILIVLFILILAVVYGIYRGHHKIRNHIRNRRAK